MSKRDRPFIVGLTGGIGSGKSAATDYFSRLGICIVDADEIAHALTAAGGKAMQAIREAFGDTVITHEGALDRVAMRARAFNNEEVRLRLESILHPMIRTEAHHRTLAAQSPYVVLSAPLLIESNHWRERCDRICVVDCPGEVQIRRVQRRSGLTGEEVLAIMNTQASRSERLAAADDVLDNSADLAALYEQIDMLHQHYIELATE